MASAPKYAEFSFDWNLRWDDYDQIGKKAPEVRQYFITSLGNVSFRWHAAMSANEQESKVKFHIQYDDGPLEKISGVGYIIGAVESDRSLSGIRTSSSREYPRSSAWGWSPFEEKDSSIVRAKYGLTESDRLTYQITMKIPIEAFAYRIPSPAPTPFIPWAVKLYDTINNDDDENSWFSDTKIASRDGVVFKCNKGIVAVQSKPLETILRYPPSQGQGSDDGESTLDDQQIVENRSKKRKTSAMDDGSSSTAIDKRVFTFPNLAAASLKSLLEYLYTGKVTTTAHTVSELIELGDGGEQYELKPLKAYCAVELWKHVVEEPESAFEIARFADLHDELKYLKHRALDVIVENYDRMGVDADELIKRFGGTRSKELRDELIEYMGRRLRPVIKP